MRNWFRFNVQALATDETRAAAIELFIYDAIGPSFMNEPTVTARQFVDELGRLTAAHPATVPIHVRVNSPGGDLFDAVTITNALRGERDKGRAVTVTIDGLAASAASLVVMAGQVIRIADNAMVMVHRPAALTFGNAGDHRKAAEDLDAMLATMLATYRWHSTLGDAALTALIEAETWMDADDAIANGFATEKIEGLKVAASFDPRVTARLAVPDRFKSRVAAFVKPADPGPGDRVAAAAVLAACAQAGLDLAFATELVDANLTIAEVQIRIAARKQSADPVAVLTAVQAAGLDVALAHELVSARASTADVTARVQAATAARTAARSRETAIRAACRIAHAPSALVESYVRSGMSPEAVREQLTMITALVDMGLVIDTTLSETARSGQFPSPSAIYARRAADQYGVFGKGQTPAK